MLQGQWSVVGAEYFPFILAIEYDPHQPGIKAGHHTLLHTHAAEHQQFPLLHAGFVEVNGPSTAGNMSSHTTSMWQDVNERVVKYREQVKSVCSPCDMKFIAELDMFVR